jgi:hypothetical protein
MAVFRQELNPATANAFGMAVEAMPYTFSWNLKRKASIWEI